MMSLSCIFWWSPVVDYARRPTISVKRKFLSLGSLHDVTMAVTPEVVPASSSILAKLKRNVIILINTDLLTDYRSQLYIWPCSIQYFAVTVNSYHFAFHSMDCVTSSNELSDNYGNLCWHSNVSETIHQKSPYPWNMQVKVLPWKPPEVSDRINWYHQGQVAHFYFQDALVHMTPGPVFTKRTDVLPQDLVTPWSC